MFAAVRHNLLGWRDRMLSPWGNRRVRRWSGLFAFEFVVVLLGVLAAQMLQEYAADARERGDARTTLERAEREAANFRATADYWLRAGPCLERQMDSIMRAAAMGSDDPTAHTGVPHLPFAALTPWSEATTVTVRREYGEQLLADYVGLRMAAGRMADVVREVAADWALLELVDSKFGPVTREDRLNARLAAASMKGRIASLRVTAGYAVSATDRLGVTADPERARMLSLPPGCGQVER